jgi:membrane protease YdiL (CAAX protease family)
MQLSMDHHRPTGSLFTFFILTFVLTWACFLTIVRVGGFPPDAPSRRWFYALLFLGVIVPALVAIALTARSEGAAGVQALLGRMSKVHVPARWYGFALGYMLTIELTSALVQRVVWGTWPRFATGSWFLIVMAIPISTMVQAGEELGWRGYALPRLAERMGLGLASLVLGGIWAFWHLPLFYVLGINTYGQSFMIYFLQTTAISVAMAWLYWRTHLSLFLVMLMHAAINNTTDIVPFVPRAATNPFAPGASSIAWITVTLMWVAALYFLIRMRSARLTA